MRRANRRRQKAKKFRKRQANVLENASKQKDIVPRT